MITSLLFLMVAALMARIFALIEMIRYRKLRAYPFLAAFLVASIARTAVLLWYANDWRGYMRVQNATENTMLVLMVAMTIECWVLMWRNDKPTSVFSIYAVVVLAVLIGYMVKGGQYLVAHHGPVMFFLVEGFASIVLSVFVLVAIQYFRWRFDMDWSLRNYAFGLFVYLAMHAVGYVLAGMRANVEGSYLIVAGSGLSATIWGFGMRKGTRY